MLSGLGSQEELLMCRITRTNKILRDPADPHLNLGGGIAAMELAALRDTLKVTQIDLADCMKVSQAAISKLEKPNRNIHVDQLRSIVSAMGGNLRIIADFADRNIELSHIGKACDSSIKKARRHKAPPAAARALRPNPDNPTLRKISDSNREAANLGPSRAVPCRDPTLPLEQPGAGHRRKIRR